MCALTDEMIYAFIHKTPTEKGAVWTNTAPSSKKPNLLDLIRAAKNKLVQAQRYDDAKDLRDIERLLMEEISGNPVTFGDIESMLSDVRDAKNAASRAEEGVGLIEQRIEKMEEALSKEMAKTHEMDDILAGVVKHVGYTSEAPMRIVAAPAQDWKDRYFQGTDPVTEGTSKMASADWSPDPEPELKFTTAGPCHTICIMPKGNPSGIPFSVALEYLKAGRRVSLPEWRRAWIQTHPAHGISFHRGYDDVVQPFDIRLNGGFNAMLSSDWMVLPEPTK